MEDTPDRRTVGTERPAGPGGGKATHADHAGRPAPGHKPSEGLVAHGEQRLPLRGGEFVGRAVTARSLHEHQRTVVGHEKSVAEGVG